MSLQTNAANVSVATQSSIDKIVGIYTGSYNSATQTAVLGGYLYQYAIPHTFTRPVFCELLWSTDGNTYVDGGASTGISYSDSNNIYVTTGNPSGTIYYKVIASWIDNYDTTNPLIKPVLNTTNRAYFDSRQNYQKNLLSGVVNNNSGSVIDVVHSLGYKPNTKVFFESLSGQVWPQIAGGSSDFWLYAIGQQELYTLIDTTAIHMYFASGSTNTRAWYRIYLDK